MSTIVDKKAAVRVTNTTEKQYTNRQVLRITREPSKFIKPVAMAILSMIPDGDPNLITYLNELVRTNTSQQQNNTCWFPTSENAGKTEDHTPKQTRILRGLLELTKKEKCNPGNDKKSRTKFHEQFDCTDTLLTEVENRAIEDILVDNHDIFGRYRGTLRWTRSSMWNSLWKTMKPYTAKVYLCRPTWRRT